MSCGIALYESPVGIVALRYEHDVIVWIKRQRTLVTYTNEKTYCSDAAYAQLQEYFAGQRQVFTFAYKATGTPFQQRVWAALCTIPYGETRTYKDIAIEIGNPNAARAVGMANNKNPISIVIPCHRVIGANGKMVGYASGIDMKQALLHMEDKVKRNIPSTVHL